MNQAKIKSVTISKSIVTARNPFHNSLWQKSKNLKKRPSGAEAPDFDWLYGTTKVVPFQNRNFTMGW